ncbi:hypothetical protein QFZ75_007373 [Streptomyces sp. V3I8]|uniref:beta-eliminating lyase-related protein n=1 Tax=Streptomyces sp. V3I8 TaxID=3042279 RepID=UPI00277DA728|nr:beta-eliminating lyase-related protein [Streptomyces sp. V3I8]MDQ1040957.1 hypothetical protein [Streptomyces sp. V3I8]
MIVTTLQSHDGRGASLTRLRVPHLEVPPSRPVAGLRPSPPHRTAQGPTGTYHPWKGNFDLPALTSVIEQHGAENVAGAIATLTCNTSGGQPMSVANLREVSSHCRGLGIPVILDIARFAENSWFVKQREEEFKDGTMSHIVAQTMTCGDIAVASAKKDGLVNIGGFCALSTPGPCSPTWPTTRTPACRRRHHSNCCGSPFRAAPAPTTTWTTSPTH